MRRLAVGRKGASAWTASRLEGRDVRIEYDRRRADRYGRTLADAWLGDTLFNEELIVLGYAQAYREDHDRLRSDFLALEREAIREGAGLWTPAESLGVAVRP